MNWSLACAHWKEGVFIMSALFCQSFLIMALIILHSVGGFVPNIPSHWFWHWWASVRPIRHCLCQSFCQSAVISEMNMSKELWFGHTVSFLRLTQDKTEMPTYDTGPVICQSWFNLSNILFSCQFAKADMDMTSGLSIVCIDNVLRQPLGSLWQILDYFHVAVLEAPVSGFVYEVLRIWKQVTLQLFSCQCFCVCVLWLLTHE